MLTTLLSVLLPWQKDKFPINSLPSFSHHHILYFAHARCCNDDSFVDFLDTSKRHPILHKLKMKSIILALATVASLAVASPHGGPYGGQCISQSDAELLVSRYAAVISASSSDLGGPVKTARAIAAKGYTEQSDSANILGGIPVRKL